MLVSVIIPSYNHEKYIEECIGSVLGQTHTELELIIIDDGSKDKSVSLIKKFNDPRLHLYEQENQGAHVAINRGLSLAKGDIITILNSDDVFAKERFAECVAVFQKENVDFITTWIEVVDDKTRKLGVKKGWQNMLPWQVESPKKSFAATDDYKLNALMTNFVSTTSNMIFRREVFEKIGGMRNLRFAHDWDFLLRVCESFQCKELPKPLMKYRIHGNNTISSSRKWMLFEICWIFAANIDRYTSTILFRPQENYALDFERLVESMNFQGNDKIVWGLMSLFKALEKQGINEPETYVLDNVPLRESIISKIHE